MLEETPIVIEASQNEFFFNRVEVLLQSSGCKNILKTWRDDIEGAVFITSSAKQFTSRCFLVNFNEQGIHIQLITQNLTAPLLPQSSNYNSDLLNEFFAAAYLAAEVQKLCTGQFIPESRPVYIKNCKINFDER